MWNLDKIHKVGELVAATAVVLSLLFVGYEIQQNNLAQKRLTTRSLARDWSNANESLQESELACIWFRFWNGSDDLTQTERVQIGILFWRVFKVHEEIHYQYLEGEMDESVWIGFRNTTYGSAANQGFRNWWSNYRLDFGYRFRQHMDDMIASTPLRANPDLVGVGCDDPLVDSQKEAGW